MPAWPACRTSASIDSPRSSSRRRPRSPRSRSWISRASARASGKGAIPLSDDDARAIRGFTFLSQKPILHCLNLSEKEIDRGPGLVESFGLQEVAARPGTAVGWVSAVIEAEVAQLAGEEQAAFLADLGLSEPALKRVLRDCYGLLGLLSFFTVC